MTWPQSSGPWRNKQQKTKRGLGGLEPSRLNPWTDTMARDAQAYSTSVRLAHGPEPATFLGRSSKVRGKRQFSPS